MFYPFSLFIMFFLYLSYSSFVNSSNENNKNSFRYIIAGGLAGGLSNAIIYPIDTIKTMKQTNPGLNIIKKLNTNVIIKLYSGLIPAVLGAIPSSALYFGTYESVKRHMNNFNVHNLNQPVNNISKPLIINRPIIHMISAACGNLASSFVFVPKETIKQQLQALKTGSITIPVTLLNSKPIQNLNFLDISSYIYKSKGIKGFYPSYRATLSKNIASAMIRFTAYEELKILFKQLFDLKHQSIGYVLAGSISSGLSSILTTPIDVIKTQLNTGKLTPGSSIILSIYHIAKTKGIIGLYAGIGERILWSSLFGGIGFTCFEYCKKILDT